MKESQSVKTTIVRIVCPECGHIQYAKVGDTIPFPTYIHECKWCKYTIMESEWQRADYNTGKKKL